MKELAIAVMEKFLQYYEQALLASPDGNLLLDRRIARRFDQVPSQVVRELQEAGIASPIDGPSSVDELIRSSRGRCIERWLAAGLELEQARELAEDKEAGGFPPTFEPRSEQPLVILTGEVGSGKSLAVERLLQRHAEELARNSDSRIPIYMAARNAPSVLDLTEIKKQASGLGDPDIQGVLLILDGADEVSRQRACELLSGIRQAVYSDSNVFAIITARPLPEFVEAPEVVPAPLLDEEEAWRLVGRIAKSESISRGLRHALPKSIVDAIRRPLFALLLGRHLRDHGGRLPHSPAELIHHLVDHCLSKEGLSDKEILIQRLGELARLVTDRGGAVAISELTGNWAEIQSLLESRLVIRRGNTLDFALPLFAQWFAAQNLLRASNGVANLPENKLDAWLYPLAIACGTTDYDSASRLLEPLARSDPAFAARVVGEAVDRWGMGRKTSLPPPVECGRQIRGAMDSWVAGLDRLASRIAPIDSHGQLWPLGVRTDGPSLLAGWFRGRTDLSEVVEIFGEEPGLVWTAGYPSAQPAWAWRWTLNRLRLELREALKWRALPLQEGPLWEEEVWLAALILTRRGNLDPRPIPLDQLEGLSSQIVRSQHQDVILKGIGNMRARLAPLRRKIADLRRQGISELGPPWPTPDREHVGGGWVWSPYSDQRLLERAQVVYARALEAYEQLVTTWFSAFRLRLSTTAVLPACLRGVVSPAREQEGIAGEPVRKTGGGALLRDGRVSFCQCNAHHALTHASGET